MTPAMTQTTRRLREFAKYSGLTVCVVSVALWVAAMWGSPAILAPGWVAACSRASVVVFLDDSIADMFAMEMDRVGGSWPKTGAYRVAYESLQRPGLAWRGEFKFQSYKPDRPLSNRIWVASIPLWVMFLAGLLPFTWITWRDRRRIQPGHCRQCGYDLTGNVSGTCPECAALVLDSGS